MSIPPQQNHLKSSHYASKSLRNTHSSYRDHYSTTTSTKPDPDETRLIPNARLATSNTSMPNDPSLKSTWRHRAWVTSGFITLLITLAKSLATSIKTQIWVEPILSFLAGYILADLGSGVYHWVIDNYGGPNTPLVGAQIEGFLRHHKQPWRITKIQFANNLHELGRAVTFTVLPMDLVLHDPTKLAFIGSLAGFVMFSQQSHAWSHVTKSKLPKIVVVLQDVGVLLPRWLHAEHHRPPYNGNYCIVSGLCNKFLDENKVFEVLEKVVFYKFGLRPRSWDEPSFEPIEDDVTISSS
ncbi:fatty acid desaturase 4, chloroplastic-like [Silene latifolia]|uniref:fatty acid desaturase 4, chloroplastic-like n=1 Tax=Silene latifolia TaxID=37657 RepID=UPI003D787364